MKHLLALVVSLCVSLCAACGGAFSAVDGVPDAADARALDGGDAGLGPEHDAPTSDGGDAGSGNDAGDASHDAGDVDAGEAGEADGGDGAVGCTYYPPAYFTFNGCATVSSGPSGFALPTTFALHISGGSECIADDTPAACTCGDTYDCGCVMPALLAEQAAQKAGAEAGLICAGTLGNCSVDAIGVIHVDCS